MGLNQTTSPWTDEKRATVARLYEEGASLTEIGIEVGATRSAIGALIKRMGITKNPTGPREEVTPAILEARRMAKRLARQLYEQRTQRKRKTGERLPPQPYRSRVAILPAEPKHLSFDEMNFYQFCAYPTHEADAPATYCGHGKGFRRNGEKSSYCDGHHAVAHS